MGNPKVSIIIPVYNLEAFILECLRSIHNQAYRDFEVILVDDGSGDNSTDLILNYIKTNSLKNWTLLQKPNGGVSSARNMGIERASGQWVTFVDGDDWIEPDFLQTLVSLTDSEDVDLVICGYKKYSMQRQETEAAEPNLKLHGTLPKDLHLLNSFDYSWARLYKKEILDRHQVRFDERIRFCEDNAFHFEYLRYVRGFFQTDYVGYVYRINRAGSLTGNFKLPYVRYHVFDYALKFYDQWKEDVARALADNKRLSSVMWNAISTEVCRHILEHRYFAGRKVLKSDFSKTVMRYYVPTTRKEKAFFALSRYSYLCLLLVTIMYYGNYDRLRKSKLIVRMSQSPSK